MECASRQPAGHRAGPRARRRPRRRCSATTCARRSPASGSSRRVSAAGRWPGWRRLRRPGRARRPCRPTSIRWPSASRSAGSRPGRSTSSPPAGAGWSSSSATRSWWRPPTPWRRAASSSTWSTPLPTTAPSPGRGLVFGEVLFRHGDYYGPVVNLAARLVDAAIPGEALVDAERGRGGQGRDDLVFEQAGRRMVKGFDQPRWRCGAWPPAADRPHAPDVPTGRFAPSPTGPLHVGNLRTAVLAWLFARSAGSPFLIRIEDLDRVASREEHVRVPPRRPGGARASTGDGPVVRQSERFDRYEAALDQPRRRRAALPVLLLAARGRRPRRPHPTARCPRAPTPAPAAT